MITSNLENLIPHYITLSWLMQLLGIIWIEKQKSAFWNWKSNTI